MAGSLIITGKTIAAIIRNATGEIGKLVAAAWKECPVCKYHIYNDDVSSQWPGLPLGVKFDPSDQELLIHLDEKIGRAASHELIDDFIPTIEEAEGICYTHPENLPGIKMDGSSSHFFHRISNAYEVGQRKRRKITNNNHIDADEQIRWHKTGASKAILDNGVVKGWKKILVLHKGKKVKTNWTLHQCHLGAEEDEKHGELVVSRVFWQEKSNNTRKSRIQVADVESDSCAVEMDPTTPNMYPQQPHRLSGSPFETEQNLDEEDPGSPSVQDLAAQMYVADVESGSPAPNGDPKTPNMYPPQPCRLSGSPLEAEQYQDEEEPGSSADQIYAGLPLLRDVDIHEKAAPLDYPGMDELFGSSDLDFTFLEPPREFSTPMDSLWLDGNVA
uniref:Uncharacterized protein n=1 Tax=Avena sativa TaxID=4498 RepID=A0ACD5UCK1_AVESA